MPVLGPVLLGFTWMLMAVAIPTIGLAVLYFPTRCGGAGSPPVDRAGVVARQRAAGLIGGLSTAYLLGLDAVAPAVAWLAVHPWVFNLAWAIGLAGNIAILFEAVLRYKRNPDSVERRRIKSVLVTGVPGMLAYVLMTAVPTRRRQPRHALPLALADRGGARNHRPALGLRVGLRGRGAARDVAAHRAAAGAAVRAGAQDARHPDRRCRSCCWYRLIRSARSAALGDHPGPAAVLSRFARPHRARPPLSGRGSRSGSIAVSSAPTTTRREILLSLASRVPHETDPRALLSLVLTDMESALHPARRGAGGERRHLRGRRGPSSAPRTRWPPSSGLAQLLQWSDAPLEIFLNDSALRDRAAAGRRSRLAARGRRRAAGARHRRAPPTTGRSSASSCWARSARRSRTRRKTGGCSRASPRRWGWRWTCRVCGGKRQPRRAVWCAGARSADVRGRPSPSTWASPSTANTASMR